METRHRQRRRLSTTLLPSRHVISRILVLLLVVVMQIHLCAQQDITEVSPSSIDRLASGDYFPVQLLTSADDSESSHGNKKQRRQLEYSDFEPANSFYATAYDSDNAHSQRQTVVGNVLSNGNSADASATSPRQQQLQPEQQQHYFTFNSFPYDDNSLKGDQYDWSGGGGYDDGSWRNGGWTTPKPSVGWTTPGWEKTTTGWTTPGWTTPGWTTPAWTAAPATTKKSGGWTTDWTKSPPSWQLDGGWGTFPTTSAPGWSKSPSILAQKAKAARALTRGLGDVLRQKASLATGAVEQGGRALVSLAAIKAAAANQASGLIAAKGKAARNVIQAGGNTAADIILAKGKGLANLIQSSGRVATGILHSKGRVVQGIANAFNGGGGGGWGNENTGWGSTLQGGYSENKPVTTSNNKKREIGEAEQPVGSVGGGKIEDKLSAISKALGSVADAIELQS